MGFSFPERYVDKNVILITWLSFSSKKLPLFRRGKLIIQIEQSYNSTWIWNYPYFLSSYSLEICKEVTID